MSLGPDVSLFLLPVWNASGYGSEAAAIKDLNLSLFIVHRKHFAHLEIKHGAYKSRGGRLDCQVS